MKIYSCIKREGISFVFNCRANTSAFGGTTSDCSTAGSLIKYNKPFITRYLSLFGDSPRFQEISTIV